MKSVTGLAAVVLYACISSLAYAGAATDATQWVNVSADSAAGWTPSLDQKTAAAKAFDDYFGYLDGGRFQEAYGLQSEANRALQPYSAFEASGRQFHDKAGNVRTRKILAVTWTKDPPKAPVTGIYVAIDVATQFDNIDRDCGYIVMYQPSSGGSFSVAREQTTLLDNATAQQIAQQHSADYVESTWAQLASRSCPNYHPATVADQPLPEVHGEASPIGYASYSEALQALKTKPGVTVVVTKPDGWIILSDPSTMAVWSFTPEGNYAYPAVVRRVPQPTSDGVAIQMAVLCRADKVSCDRLVREFTQLNDRMAADLTRRAQTGFDKH